MVLLPSSGDVQQVSPRINRDPGVTVPSTRVPQGAFDSPVGVAAEEFSVGLGKLAVIAEKQERSNAVVDMVDREEQFHRDLDEEFRRVNNESDLSQEEVLQQYGQFVSTRKRELLESFNGPDDLRVRLFERMQNVESDFIGKVSSESTKLRRDKIIRAHDRTLAPLIQQVSQNPSPQNIDKAMLSLEQNIGDLQDGLDISSEELLRTDREEIALASLDSLILRGRDEQAEVLLDTHLLNDLSPENQRAMRNKIQNVREKRETARLQSLQNTVRILPQSEVRSRFPSLPAGSIVEETVDQTLGVSKGITIKHTPSQDVNQNAVKIASLASALQQNGVEETKSFELARGYVMGQTAFDINNSTGQVLVFDAAKILAGDPTGVTELPVATPEPPPLETQPRGSRGEGTPQPSQQPSQQTAIPFAPEAQDTEQFNEQQEQIAFDNLIQGGGIDVSQANGLVGFLRKATNVVVDAVGGGLPFPRAEEAANELNNLQLATFGALREQIPGRENVMIDKKIETLVVEPNSVFTGKGSALNKLKKLKDTVDQELQRIEVDVLPLTLTQEIRQKTLINRTILNQQSINLQQVIDAFGEGDAQLAKPINQMTLEELNSLDLDRLSDAQIRQAQQQSAVLSGQPINVAEGQTAINPNTGERIIFRNGQWELLQQ